MVDWDDEIDDAVIAVNAVKRDAGLDSWFNEIEDAVVAVKTDAGLDSSMLSRGALLQYARFYFLQSTYRCLPWLAWHGWWSRLTSSSSWWVCCDDFCCFVWLAWKKSDNAILEKQFGKRSNR
jgi:hypothetical protein